MKLIFTFCKLSRLVEPECLTRNISYENLIIVNVISLYYQMCQKIIIKTDT